MVVAMMALLVSLGGGAYAATKLRANSVKSKTVKDNSLKGTDIDETSLDGSQIPGIASGTPGPKGDNGSADTPQQVLDKLKTVDGQGSDLDADEVGGKQSCQTKPAVVMATGHSQILCEIGTSRLTGSCILNGSLQTAAFVQADSTVGPAATGVAGADGSSIGAGGTGTTLALDTSIGTGGPGTDGPGHGTFFVVAEDGSQLTGVVGALAESTNTVVGTCAFTVSGLG
jgi:hypothetical protein